MKKIVLLLVFLLSTISYSIVNSNKTIKKSEIQTELFSLQNPIKYDTSYHNYERNDKCEKINNLLLTFVGTWKNNSEKSSRMYNQSEYIKEVMLLDTRCLNLFIRDVRKYVNSTSSYPLEKPYYSFIIDFNGNCCEYRYTLSNDRTWHDYYLNTFESFDNVLSFNYIEFTLSRIIGLSDPLFLPGKFRYKFIDNDSILQINHSSISSYPDYELITTVDSLFWERIK